MSCGAPGPCQACGTWKRPLHWASWLNFWASPAMTFGEKMQKKHDWNYVKQYESTGIDLNSMFRVGHGIWWGIASFTVVCFESAGTWDGTTNQLVGLRNITNYLGLRKLRVCMRDDVSFSCIITPTASPSRIDADLWGIMGGQPKQAAGKHRIRGDINTLIVGVNRADVDGAIQSFSWWPL